MDLNAEVNNLKGVGPKTAESLKKAGIFTVRDLLYYLPREYENYQVAAKIRDLRPGKVVVRGKIDSLSTKRTRRSNLAMTEGIIQDETGVIRVVWFNQAYRARQFVEEKEYYFTGNYEFKFGRYQLMSPKAVLAEDVDTAEKFQPVYPQRGGLKSAVFLKLIRGIRADFSEIPDLLPMSEGRPNFIFKGARAEALFKVHFPEDLVEVEKGRQYLAYEELFELILAAQLNREEGKKLPASSLEFRAEWIRELISQLPFKLTNAQRRASWEILQDLEKKIPMNRLLQGDVGAGKTVVAAIAAYQAIKNGFQVAFLAPTAILANQHKESLEKILGGLGVKIGLLTGSTKKKAELKKQVADGKIGILVGTHALLTDDTEFAKLAFCIIDEQHRFGVEQRQKLLLKSQEGLAPHLLAMTATPIPRSLQLTIFGDLAVSILDELPKGRKEIQTQILNEINLKDELYPSILEKIKAGQQVYWICRAIEEKEGARKDKSGAEIVNVKKQTEKLRKVFPRAKIEFLHGKMKPKEKDEIMERFSQGKIQILVSTTVVEVGVDVPNATVIVIMDAEGYGLAQLHQLRGRVGRGQVQSFCYLVVSGEEKPSRRLRELKKSTDGFYLAEVDLKMRGPGEIYGSLQHGALDLRVATITDGRMVALASRQAKIFVQKPENMVKYKELCKAIQKYQQITTLN